MSAPRSVLVLNSGSSSLKYAILDISSAEPRQILANRVHSVDENGAFAAIDAAVGGLAPVAIAHRIVHGGPRLLRHCAIDAAVVAELERATAFAPLHLPTALALIDAARRRYPGIPQIACFDTAFHAGLPAIARTLPLPRHLCEDGLHRYGFHGLSCESIVHRFGVTLPARLVIAHLGGGASVTAVRDGHSIDTSMGLTPAGGAIMATRTGDLDPGVLIHLMQARGYGPDEVERVVNRESGMLGISGVSGDMRVLHSAREPDAALAITIFCRSVAKQIAGMMVALGGADAIVFTGGIGEHDPVIRRMICDDLAWAGVTTSEVGDPPGPGHCPALPVPSDEATQIARYVRGMLTPNGL